MNISDKRLNDIEAEDLQILIRQRQPEDKELEYKATIELVTDRQLIEFCSDVTALANTRGGMIIFGLKAEAGIASELVGLRNFNADATINQMENLLRDLVQPRLVGTEFHPVDIGDGRQALLVRVPQSFSAPHMVRLNGITRFCGRNANGKYDLDVFEIRSSVLAAEGLANRIKAFRLHRVQQLIAGEYPISMVGNRIIVLHVVPIVAGRPDFRLSATDLCRCMVGGTPRPICCEGWSDFVNFDGLLVAWPGCPPCGSYVQVFRSGAIEAVESQMLHHPMYFDMLLSPFWEEEIIRSFPTYLQAPRNLDIQYPFICSLSLLNVQGVRIYSPSGGLPHAMRPIDRDHLMTDEFVIESGSEEEVASVMRKMFDQVWNACGMRGSLNYTPDGKRKVYGC